MSKLKTVWLIFLSLSVLFLLPPLSLAQTELTVSIGVGDTILTLSGKTSLNASVTVIEGSSVVGTTTADSQGNFSKSLLAQTPGIHNIGIYSTDTTGVTTSTVTYSVSLTSLVETTLSNIILPPTISLSGTGIAKGDNVDIYGYGAVSSTVSLLITGQTAVNTTSDSSGYWKYTFETGSLTVGSTYDAYAKITTPAGYQSESSETKSFSINAAPTATPGPTTPGPTATSTPVPAKKIVCLLPLLIRILYDPNNNCRIEKEEIFTVVKTWTEFWSGFIKEVYAVGLEGEAKGFQNCDFNRDDACNLIDLSILLFYIER